MRRVWAAVLSVWALLALVAVLAWTRAPTPVAQPGRTVVIHTAGGARTVVLGPPAHATTQTSPGTAHQQSVMRSPHGPAVVTTAPAGGNN